MEIITYRLVAAGSTSRLRPVLREIAAQVAPAVSGLRSRHWRIDRGAIQGRYMFQDRASLEAFARDPKSDPAFCRIADQTGDLPPSEILREEVGSEEVASMGVLDRPVFIISAPRSGSTLLYELLAQSDGVFTLDGESEGVIEGIPSLHPATRGYDSHRLTDLDLDPQTADALDAGFVAGLRDRRGRRYLDLAGNERPPRIRMLEKTPENALRVAFLAARYPAARFVFLHRDARQSVNSMFEAWRHEGFVKIPHLPGWRLGRWHLLLPEGWRELNDVSLLEVAAFQWNAANHRALEDLEALPREQWLSVEYAQLVAAPEAVARRVWEFADIAFDDHLAAALARPLPLSSTTITPPSPIKWHNNPEFRESVLDRYTRVMKRLRDLGRQSAPPPPPRGSSSPIRFSCFLDQMQPQPEPASGDWIVNPSFQFQMGATIPIPLLRRTRFREKFVADFPMLWVEDASTSVMYPFWVRRGQAFLFRQFAAGQPPPTLDAELAARLIGAGILTTCEDLDRRRGEGAALVERALPQFAEHRYCTLPSLMDKSQAAALGRYYRELIDHGEWLPGDEQVRLRHGYHNETVSRYFHWQFTDFISRVAGEPVKPSYCYVSAYKPGAVLRPHVDRKQCVFTVSLWIDHAPPRAAAEPWPLWFQTHNGKVSVTQASGDAVLFRGCELPHWRDRPPEGSASTTLLFHYVPRDFVGVLD